MCEIPAPVEIQWGKIPLSSVEETLRLALDERRQGSGNRRSGQGGPFFSPVYPTGPGPRGIGRPGILPGSFLHVRYYAVEYPQNCGRWDNKEFNALLTKILLEPDFKKRKAIYDQAQEIIVDEDVVRLILWYGVEDIALPVS